jgi:hypothetical protein
MLHSDAAPTPTPSSRRPSARWMWISLAADALLIVLFAALGRRTHESGLDPLGILETAAPFLLAWAMATAASRPRRTWTDLWPAGVVVWVVTVVGGLLLRVAFGDTAAVSFQVVTACVLGIFLLGRRTVTALILRRHRGGQS